MHNFRIPGVAVAALATSLAIPAAAGAQGPPPPTAANGATVKTVAGGINTPTSFAFRAHTVFVGAFGPENESGGGVYRLRHGKAKRLKNSPHAVSGVAWRGRSLYVASARRIVRMSRWNGHRFLRKKTIYRGPQNFDGFGGIAFGPDGRLYAGVTLNGDLDQKPDTSPYARSVVSMTARGQDIKVVATGLRQPWQLTFVKGNPNPFVSVLADERTPTPPDWIVNAKPGQNYGYPTCTQAVRKDCKGFAKPIALLQDHSSPMGIRAIGQTLYVALFGGPGGNTPEVVTMNTNGKQVKPFLTGYVAPVLAVGARRGFIYTGDLTGTIYRVKAG